MTDLPANPDRPRFLRDRRVPTTAGIAIGVALLVLSTPAAQSVHAACNLIPGTTLTFAGTLGATNRPFAAPGEPVEIQVRTCDTTSPGFASDGDDHVVSVVFKPAAGGTGKLVAIATNCAAVNTGACSGSVCKQVTAGELAMVVRDGVPNLRFLFPDTDAEQLPDSDGHVLAGPAAIAVTKIGEPLPCGLKTGTCAGQSGLTACVDTIFFNDGNCGETGAHPTFTSFTALPRPNDYEDACFSRSPPCDANADNIRMAIDGAGNLFVPFDWSGVLSPTASPVPRLMVTTMQPPVLSGQPPLKIPSQAFLASYTPEGGLLPPIFEPQSDPDAAPGTVRLFGSADAPYTVLRLSKRAGKCVGPPNNGMACSGPETCKGAPCNKVCVGGTNDGNTCSTAGDCPGSNALCGALFDVAALAGTGALVIPRVGPGICQQSPHGDCSSDIDCPDNPGNPCVLYALEAQTLVPLDGLVGTDAGLFFVVSEKVDIDDLNGDAATDQSIKADDVITLRDRDTGDVQPIGNNLTCGINEAPEDEPPGRAIAMQSEQPFVFPAVAAEGNVVAFLESEPSENQCDANGDGDRADAILRVFRLGPTEVTAGQNRAVDGKLAVNGHSLAVSNGLVFVRTPEYASGVSSTIWASVDPSGGGGDDTSVLLGSGRHISGDGRYVIFSSYAQNLIANPAARGVYVRDLLTGTTEAVDVNQSGTPVGGGWEMISADGKFAAFFSTQFVLPGWTGVSQLYVRDLVNDVTEYASTDSDELVIGDDGSSQANISRDGRYVVFSSEATNLAAPCNNGKLQIFLRDRDQGTTTCLSVNGQGVQGDGNSEWPQISDDGRIVVYNSVANNLVDDDVNGSTLNGDLFMLDRSTGDTTLVSRRSDGTQVAPFTFIPALSADGRYMAFDNYDSTPCTFGLCVTVKDLQTGALEIPFRDVDGDAFSDVGVGSFSSDGRFLTVYAGTPMTPGDANGKYDIFVGDRLTGITQRVSTGPGGITGNDRSYLPWVSDDGRTVVFQSWASNLVENDTIATCDTNLDSNFTDNCMDVFVHRIGPPDHCGNSTVDAGEDCDPPGAPGACGGNDCSLTCHCGDATADLTGDDTFDQTVLQVVNGTSGAVTTLCPAEQVAVSGGTAAFLRPEAAGSLPNLPGCPGPFPSLNSPTDNDATDTVVQLSVLGGPVQNLGRGATALALGATCSTSGAGCSADADCPDFETCRPPYLAALVSEPQEGGLQLNAGDTDGLDTVLNIYRITAPAGWQPIASVQAADSVDMKGNLAVFLTPETSQGTPALPLNGDGSADDRVLRVYDASSGTLTDVALAGEEFVLGAPAYVDCGSGPVLHQVIAFRTRESAQGPGSLNSDTDAFDDVLNVIDYDVGAQMGTLIPTGRAVTRCPIEACDPRLPYRVSGKTVKFLTREQDEGGKDLNGDNDASDLVLNTFDVCTEAITAIATVDETQDDSATQGGEDPLADPLDGSSAVVSEGARCVQGSTVLLVPATCVDDDDCPAGSTCTATRVVVATPLEDLDGDGVPDGVDNCPLDFNDTQADADGDGVGDVCDERQSGCAAVPLTTCKEPTEPLQALLLIKDKSTDTSDGVLWKWKKGAETMLDDFGDPLSGDDYSFCLYAGGAQLVFQAAAPAGGTCAGQPCWQATGSTGFKYSDRDATPQGLTQVKLKAGDAGKARVQVKGKGVRLVLPVLGPELSLPIVAQLQNGNGECWSATHDPAGVVKNTTEQFKGKGSSTP